MDDRRDDKRLELIQGGMSNGAQKALQVFTTPSKPGKHLGDCISLLRAVPGIDSVYWDAAEGSVKFAYRMPHDITNQARIFPSALEDGDISRLNAYLNETTGAQFSSAIVDEAINALAEERVVNPIPDYLNSLTWDGVARLDLVASAILGAETAIESRLVRKWMVAAVARQLRPGCKADTMLVLVGSQGAGKSSFFNSLFTINKRNYHTEDFPDLEGAGAITLAKRSIQGYWCVSSGELTVMKRADLARLKNFLTQDEDAFDEKFKRKHARRPRRCVFAGTTNETKFLRDPTGARRFWPIKVNGKVDFEKVRELQDDLWAEATAAYKAGEHWNIDESDYGNAAELADRFKQEPDWSDNLYNYLGGSALSMVSVYDVYDAVFGEGFDSKRHWKEAQQMSDIAASIGWERVKIVRDGKKSTVFKKTS